MRTAVVALVLTANLGAATRALLPGCCQLQSSISLADPNTGAVHRQFEVTGPAVAIALPGSGRYAFLANVTDDGVTPSSISKVDLLTNKIAASASYPLGTTLTNIAANPVTGIVYVIYLTSGLYQQHLQTLSQASLAVVNDITLPDGLDLPLAVSPAGDLLFLGVYVFRSSDLGIVGTINTTLPTIYGTAVTKDGSTLYVLGSRQTYTSEIDVVDVKSLTVTAAIPFQNPLTLIALSADESHLYLSGFVFKNLMVFDLADSQTDLYALTWSPGSMAVVDEGSKVVLGGGPNPYEVNQPAGFAVYDVAAQQVSSYATASPEQVVPSSGEHIVMLDASNPTAITETVPATTIERTIPLGQNYGQGALDENDGLILFPVQDAQAVQMIELTTLKTKGLLSLPSIAYWVSYSGGAAYALVQDASEQVVRFDPVTMQTTGTFTLPALDYLNIAYQVSPAVTSSDGSLLYVPFDYYINGFSLVANPLTANSDPQTGLAIFDTSTTALIDVVPFAWIGGIAIAPSGTHGYVNIQESDGTLAVVDLDLKTGHVLRSVKSASSVLYAPILGVPLLSPDASTIYAFMNSELVSVDTASFQVISRFPNQEISGVALTPDGKYVYASVSGAFLILDASSLKLAGQVPSQCSPCQPALFLTQ